MSRNYDNWERLVAAVLRREELWQLCHEDSREPSINSASSDFSSSSSRSSSFSEDFIFRNSDDTDQVLALWETQYKRGVYVTLKAFADGTRIVKGVRFSGIGIEEQQQAEVWWLKNQERVYKKYNAWGGISAVIRRPSDVTFSWSPLNIVDEKTLLNDLKQLVQESLNNHEFNTTSSMEYSNTPQEVFIWGVKLMEDERSDVILLKFLRARDYDVNAAFTMISNTVKWRKEFGIDELIEEELGGMSELNRVVFMDGYSKEGDPVCYNVYGELENKELYGKVFSDEEKMQQFLRWRIQFLEKSIRKLDFSPEGVSTMVQVNDLKNSPGPSRLELRQATNQALQLVQDNYPEYVAKQIFINAPWWYLALIKMINPFLTQRAKNKFVFSKSTEILFKYISAEQIPKQYGGFSKLDGDFGVDDSVSEIVVRPATKNTLEYPVPDQVCIGCWELRVVGWEVMYGVEFVPSVEDSYTWIVQKVRRIGSNEEQVTSGSFKVGESGKFIFTIDNLSSKEKKLLYRFKTKFPN